MGLFSRKDWRERYKRLADRELLERIRSGDRLAEEYVWLDYHSVVWRHMEAELGKRGTPDQVGTPEDFAQDALLLLIEQARRTGSDVLKHVYTTIGGWLKQTATNFMRNALRRDARFERDQWQTDEEGLPKSKLDNLDDKGADSFADMPEKDRDQIIHQALERLPEELQTLIRLKFLEGFTWKETTEQMLRLYPNHDPPFELAYLQKTYWDRVHKKPFIKRLSIDLDDL